MEILKSIQKTEVDREFGTQSVDSELPALLLTKSRQGVATSLHLLQQWYKVKCSAQRQHVMTGLIVLPEKPWLCCSPDGLIKLGDDSIVVEIKRPHRCIKSPIVDDETKKCFVEYLHFVNGELCLRQTYCYYTQLRIQLYILNLPRDIFCVQSTANKDITCTTK